MNQNVPSGIAEVRHRYGIAVRRPNPAPEAPTAMIRAAFQAFGDPYLGHSHELLIEVMDFELSLKKPYNRAKPIVQSSGTGKSRMVDHAAELRFTFPFNLREDLHSGNRTYPPPDDKAVRKYLVMKDESDMEMRDRYSVFLRCLFDATADFLQSKLQVWGGQKTLPAAWRSYLADGQSEFTVGEFRNELYISAVNQARKGFNLAQAEGQTQARSKSPPDRKRPRPSSDTPDQANKIAQVDESESKRSEADLLRISYDKLEKTLRDSRWNYDISNSTEVALLLYFDEAHPLTVMKPGRIGHTAYHNLNVVLSWLNERRVFTLFLSTNSGFEAFAPSTANHPSARDWTNSELLPPYTCMPFDTFAVRLRSSFVCTIEVMSKFGRPLWYSQRKNLVANQGNSQSVDRLLVDFALVKLHAGNASGESARYAALAIRILLDFDSSREPARALESKLVESHMRMVFAVPRHREFMRTGSPSEPILAEVAGILLDDKKSGRLERQGPEILSRAFSRGLVAKGERGEMVSRLLWTIAHDRALKEMPAHTEDVNVHFHRPIKVITFLKALYAEKWHDGILNARPVGNKKGAKLEDAFANAYIHFSHFVRTADSEVIAAPYLLKALLRGMAFQCRDNQKDIYHVMAIFFGNPYEDKLSEDKISAMQEHAKNRIEPTEFTVNPLVAFTYEKPPLHPVLTLVSEYGSTEHKVEAHYSIDRSTVSGRNPHANHYQIVAHGHTHETYSAIPSDISRLYESMLAAHKTVDDFPYNDQEQQIEGFNRQKPEFGKEAAFWDWSAHI